MNSGKYKLKSFFTDNNLDQVVVPEIQRDYVWRHENVIKLLNTIKLNADRQKSVSQTISDEQMSQLPPDARDLLIRALEEQKQFCNVGFIYAYFDPELVGRFVLIDGQQRMTTLFLLLLCCAINENKIDDFKRSYFPDRTLKFDYKVREEAHEFLENFVDHMLKKKSLADVEDQHWFYREYKTDSTISALLNNYSVIDSYLQKNQITMEYVENHIEFWYFDTNKSKQGEELYIYMNSRGVAVSSNESVKASLLKNHSEKEKHEWGEKWEKWQDFFWKHKGNNSNADKGFEEFLRWVNVIEHLKDRRTDAQHIQASKVREIKDSKKISDEYFTLNLIEKYFSALKLVLQFKDLICFEEEWLEGQTDGIDYIRLLPVIMFALTHPTCSATEIQRFSRFFFNVSKFESISRAPYQALIAVVSLSLHFLEVEYIDAADLICFANNKIYESILTQEEVVKFSLYATQADENSRTKIETLFWEAEDNRYSNGKISFLWDYMQNGLSISNISTFNFNEFVEIFDAFKTLFILPDDLLRRALLTKGDYSTYDGRTSTLNGDRYSFIAEDSRWRQQLPNKNKAPFFKALVLDFCSRRSKNSSSSRKDILNQIITEYLLSTPMSGWRYHFISNPSVLAYCKQKFACFSSENVYLLQDRNAAVYNWVKLEDHLTL